MYDLKRFFEHLQKNSIYATESDLRQIIYHYIMKHKLKPKTLVCVLAVVKEFYRFLYSFESWFCISLSIFMFAKESMKSLFLKQISLK
jgi:site-specific recombinase XerD